MARNEHSWLQLRQVDVFTDRPNAGNPLAVVLGADGLSEGRMQEIAREMNLSETSFVTRPTKRDADYRIRIFTPERELAFAGHPSIGTAHVLMEEGLVQTDDFPAVVCQEVGIGVLPLEIFVRRGEPTRIVMTQGTPRYHETFEGVEVFASALGITETEIEATGLVPQIVSTGLKQMMVPVGSLKTVASMTPDMAGLSRLEKAFDYTGCSVFSLETLSEETSAHVRFFAPAAGVPEDPATGSAAGALGAYLLRQGVLDATRNPVSFTIEQGEELGRPSRIYVEVSHDQAVATEVRVGGTAVTVAKGELAV